MNWESLQEIVGIFCFGYPFVMAYFWMVGALLYYFVRERRQPMPSDTPSLEDYPPVSILVPCFNEEGQLEETFAALAEVKYPDYEVIAINDGSSDRTAEILDSLAEQMPNLRVIHMASNRGKSTALNTGAMAARSELLVCIDSDTLIEENAVLWIVRRFQSDPLVGAIAGNPRIRNRSTMLGHLQVGEFSGMVGLIRRAQSVYGTFYTVSGAICAFRKRALHEAGWWAPGALTDDVDVSWRIQLAGWNIALVPKAVAWILTPETLGGLWRQRVRWSEGGTSVTLRATPYLFQRRGLRMWPIWLNFMAAVLWSYSMLLMLAIWAASLLQHSVNEHLLRLGHLLNEWSPELAVTYLLQMLVAAFLDGRYEHGVFRSLLWVIWYPLIYWMLQAAAAVVGLPKAILNFKRLTGTWRSPDRGFR
ncbi:poly-beta-1,6-N-acetyl-D-glucosamine synthase [Microbulbifer aestuariivivens]|uniref:Poly-beta-1,6-N-acetyl-D-glucosamine synthase n=1 Tax=Microbulbifer aestuariivivens TaxID=1908308 RepID=A0ABP9WRS7_9GAMM